MSSRNNLFYNADRVPSPHSFVGYPNMKRTLKPDDPSLFTTEFDRGGFGGPGDGGYGGPGDSDLHGGVGVGVGDPSRGMPNYHAPLQHVQDPSQLQLSHHQPHPLSHHPQHPHPHALSHPQHQQHPQQPTPQPPQQQQPQHHHQQQPPQQSHPQQSQQPQQTQQPQQMAQSMTQPTPASTTNPKKRQRASGKGSQGGNTTPSGQTAGASGSTASPAKRSRTNTAWTQAEEQLLKTMRDAGSSWSDIAKSFPSRTEGSVKKHWYKDMHWAEFGEEESAQLLAAIKEYDANKWKVIGMKVNKPAKACEAYAKEHFGNKI